MKKQIPIAMLRIIDPLIKLAVAEGLAKQIDDANRLAHFVDADEYDVSDFYFYIENQNQNNRFRIQFKPHSPENNNGHAHELELKQIEPYLKNWLSILRQYRDLQTVFDNPDRYRENQYYQEAKITDKDAEYASFAYDKLIILDSYFEDVSNHLIEILPNSNEEKSIIIKGLLTEITELREETPTLSKNQVIQRLAKLFTNGAKAGMSILKAIYGKFKEKIIDKISDTSVEVLAEKANDLIDTVNQAL